MTRIRRTSRPATPTAVDEAFLPIPVVELELSQSTNVIEANAKGQIHLLVRMHGVPLGTLFLVDTGQRDPAAISALVAEKFHDQLVRHLRQDGLPSEDPLMNARAAGDVHCVEQASPSSEFVSVIICTLGEDPRLRAAVGSVLAQSHTNFELVVVDNDPASARVATALADVVDPRLRVVAEHRRGLSVARNAGVAAAQAAIVAFTDDDAVADREWLKALISPFRDYSELACVTGLVLPAELATRAQVWFEEFGAFDKGFTRLVWSARDDDAELKSLGAAGERGVLFPYSCGVFGSGNNMAFRTDFLRAQNLFDVALGAGTLARGGEDLDAFLTVMLSGGVIIYEPRALIKHFARSDEDALHRQMYGYGVGMCAVIAKHILAGPRGALRIAARVPAGARKLLDPRSEKNESRTASFPKEMARAELAGYVTGPWLYVRSRRAARRRGLYASPRPA